MKKVILALGGLCFWMIVIVAWKDPEAILPDKSVTKVEVPLHTEKLSHPLEMPEDEKEFIRIVSDAQAKYGSVSNDMQKGGIKAEREKKLCELAGKMQAINWVGKITRLESSGKGNGILAVEIAPDIILRTFDTDDDLAVVGNDEGIRVITNKRQLLDPESEIFKKVSQLEIGAKIIFSHHFYKGNESDCLEEDSLTLDGKLAGPEFIVAFKDIK